MEEKSGIVERNHHKILELEASLRENQRFESGDFGSMSMEDLEVGMKRRMREQTMAFDEMRKRARVSHAGVDSCPICMTESEMTDPIRIRCGHIFCRGCIAGHFKSSSSLTPTCPMCRSPINAEDLTVEAVKLKYA